MPTYADAWNQRRAASAGSFHASTSSFTNNEPIEERSRQGPVTITLDDPHNDGPASMVESMEWDEDRAVGVLRDVVAQHKAREGVLGLQKGYGSSTYGDHENSLDGLRGPPRIVEGSSLEVLGKLVLDTNILIGQLSLIKDLVACLAQVRSQSGLYIQFVVPFIVLQELDGLTHDDHITQGQHNAEWRNSDRYRNFLEMNSSSPHLTSSSLSRSARRAITYLLGLVRANDPCITLQRSELAAQGRDQAHANSKGSMGTEHIGEGNDDLVLGACRYISDYEVISVRLLTNDSNLTLKANAYGVECVSIGLQVGLSDSRLVCERLGIPLDQDSGPASHNVGARDIAPKDIEMSATVDLSAALSGSMDTVTAIALIFITALFPPVRDHLMRTIANDDEDTLNYLAPQLSNVGKSHQGLIEKEICEQAYHLVASLRRLWWSGEIQELYKWDTRPKQDSSRIRQDLVPNLPIRSFESGLRSRDELDAIKDRTLTSLESIFKRRSINPGTASMDSATKRSFLDHAEILLLGGMLIQGQDRERIQYLLEFWRHGLTSG